MSVRWSHCVLKVRDIDQMIGFYCDALGFRVTDRGSIGPDTEIAFMSSDASDHHQMALMSGRTDDGRGALDHNAFRVDSIDEVKRMVAWLDADERVKGGFPITHGNAVSVYFNDPEGNGVELFCDTPWHVRQPQVGGWDPTRSVDEILAAVEQEFADKPEFMPMEQYRLRQAEVFAAGDR